MRDDPRSGAQPPSRQAEANERSGEDDDVDEERAGERQRNLGSLVGAAVNDADREVRQHDRRQRLPLLHTS